MKASSFELEQAAILASRLCAFALDSDVEAFRAYAVTEIAMELARHRRRYSRQRHRGDPAFV
jgi:hypothetical protein